MTNYDIPVKTDLIALEYIGGILWIFGFLVEVIADCQKTSFRED
jgi:steroid 5-alpha reductase family enzyme